MEDHNLLAVVQNGYDITFHKTSTGYAEGGGQVDTPFGGAGYDFSVSGAYGEVSPREVLAYFDYNWQQIYRATIELASKSDRPINPILVRNALELEMVSIEEASSAREHDAELQRLLVTWKAELDALWEKQEPIEDPEFNLFTPFTMEPSPVFIKLDDFSLLRVSQRPYKVSLAMDPVAPVIEFHKTSPGYGVTGAKANFLGFGGGGEIPRSHIYAAITPAEALALVNGDMNRILSRVEQLGKALRGIEIDLDATREVLKNAHR
jgi:hypothetical protein